jgi:hypothetical protein
MPLSVDPRVIAIFSLLLSLRAKRGNLLSLELPSV